MNENKERAKTYNVHVVVLNTENYNEKAAKGPPRWTRGIPEAHNQLNRTKQSPEADLLLAQFHDNFWPGIDLNSISDWIRNVCS